ncbi:hypothetical protein CesoFtcFv8_015056 [Champsocephalus esox]|uniref:Uncharacterized protein n=1 Tax=Champsocephalus esox TaxID=159716 RepID=A0AAN8GUS6_9TELE|nr:hypothetical protein CesoFtcFv8_015056 [Champsocephalus esox]
MSRLVRRETPARGGEAPYILNYRTDLECLTYDRLPGVLPNTHKPHLYCLYPGQLSAGTWPKRKTHLSRSFKVSGTLLTNMLL